MLGPSKRFNVPPLWVRAVRTMCSPTPLAVACIAGMLLLSIYVSRGQQARSSASTALKSVRGADVTTPFASAPDTDDRAGPPVSGAEEDCTWHTSQFGFEYVHDVRIVVFDYSHCPATLGAFNGKGTPTCLPALDAFRRVTLPTLLPLAFDYLPVDTACPGCNLDAWLEEHASDCSFRYVVAMAAGSFIADVPAFKAALLHELDTMRSLGVMLSGHIINMRGAGNDGKHPYLEEQLIILDKTLWGTLGAFTRLGGPYDPSFTFPSHIVSSQVLHEKFAPLYIESVEMLAKTSPQPVVATTHAPALLGTALMAVSLDKGRRVTTIPASVRATIGFTFPSGIVEKFWIAAMLAVQQARAPLQALAGAAAKPELQNFPGNAVPASAAAAERLRLADAWMAAYAPPERWVTVRVSARTPCFEISCNSARTVAGWLYVATNERPAVHAGMNAAFTASRALLSGDAAADLTVEGFITVANGFQGFTAFASSLKYTDITWIATNNEQLFITRLWLELVAVSDSRHTFVSRVYARDLAIWEGTMRQAAGPAGITAANQESYLRTSVDSGLRAATRALLTPASALTFDRYLVPVQDKPLGVLNEKGEPTVRSLALFGPLVAGHYTLNYGHGMLESDAVYSSTRDRLIAQTSRVSFADLALNDAAGVLERMPAAMHDSVVVHISTEDDAEYGSIKSLPAFEEAVLGVVTRTRGHATILSTNTLRVTAAQPLNLAAAKDLKTADCSSVAVCRVQIGPYRPM